MAIIIEGIDMYNECHKCIFHINEKNDDYGWRCECIITKNQIDLLIHKRPSECPLKLVKENNK